MATTPQLARFVSYLDRFWFLLSLRPNPSLPGCSKPEAEGEGGGKRRGGGGGGGGQIMAGLEKWPMPNRWCHGVLSASCQRQGRRKAVVQGHLHLARLSVQFSMLNNVDIDCVAAHFAQLLKIA